MIYCHIIFTQDHQIIVEFEAGNYHVFNYHFFKMIDDSQFLGTIDSPPNPHWLRYRITKVQLNQVREFARKQWGEYWEYCEGETMEPPEVKESQENDLLKDWF